MGRCLESIRQGSSLDGWADHSRSKEDIIMSDKNKPEEKDRIISANINKTKLSDKDRTTNIGITRSDSNAYVIADIKNSLKGEKKMKVTIKTDDGRFYKGTMIEETKPEPRVGTLCMFWDSNEDHKNGPSVLKEIDNVAECRFPYASFGGEIYRHCEEINDPTCIIKTIAPPEAVFAYISSMGHVTFVDMHSMYCPAPGRDDAITWLTLRKEQFGGWFGRNVKLK